jgi:2-polyprenyl-3-methyl-5-hydroxy-6-metoxy-1,4-benzoquinol methylase
MKADYSVHDRQYIEARAKGWHGWGGNERMAHEHIWVERLFAYDEIPKMGDVLELGCGEGHYARLLAEKGYRVIGVDISPTAIQWAKEKTLETGHQVEYLAIDLTKPGVLRGKTFDLIVDGNCFHCIIDQDRKIFLANVQRLLKVNGVFFVYSKCSHAANAEVAEFEGKPYRYVPSQENLHRELEAAGFEIKKSDFHRREVGAHSHCTVHLTKR